MGVVETADLGPEGGQLALGKGADIGQRGAVVDQLPVPEHRDQQLFGRVVRHRLALPGGLRVEQLQRAAVHTLVVEADVVREALPLRAVDAPDLLEARVGDLGHVLADFDFGDDVPLFVLDGGELVHPAEHALAAGGDQPLAHAEHVDFRPLADQAGDQALVEGV